MPHTSTPPTLPLPYHPAAFTAPQYEEARKVHIQKLQAALACGSTDNLVANSFQFNPDGPTKEERLGLNK
jgi:hypothetical protein